jgi:basic amino acid/polyamine antiporter, APA family
VERRLGLPSAIALVVGNVVGVGVFTTSGFALADLGSREAVLLAWAVGGAAAMCGALSYGALARRFPVSGGEYAFLSVTVHPFAGFVAGWISLLAGFTAPIAVAALALAAHLEPFTGALGDPRPIATAAILAVAAVHGLRLRPGVVVQNAAVAIQVALIVAFVAIGGAGLSSTVAIEARPPTSVDLGAFAVTLVWISFSYSGWNAVVYVAGEVARPERNLARSLVVATALVTLLYLALNVVFLYAAPIAVLSGRADVATIAAGALGGEPLRRFVAALVTLGLATSISAMTMAGPRVYARMAEDGLFPRVFAASGEVPVAAVALQATLAIVAVWIAGLRELLGYVGFTLGLSAAATVFGLLRLRRREGAARVPIPGYPLVPLAFVATTLVVSAFMALRAPGEATIGLLTAASAVPLWLWTRRRK